MPKIQQFPNEPTAAGALSPEASAALRSIGQKRAAIAQRQDEERRMAAEREASADLLSRIVAGRGDEMPPAEAFAGPPTAEGRGPAPAAGGEAPPAASFAGPPTAAGRGPGEEDPAQSLFGLSREELAGRLAGLSPQAQRLIVGDMVAAKEQQVFQEGRGRATSRVGNLLSTGFFEAEEQEFASALRDQLATAANPQELAAVEGRIAGLVNRAGMRRRSQARAELVSSRMSSLPETAGERRSQYRTLADLALIEPDLDEDTFARLLFSIENPPSAARVAKEGLSFEDFYMRRVATNAYPPPVSKIRQEYEAMKRAGRAAGAAPAPGTPPAGGSGGQAAQARGIQPVPPPGSGTEQPFEASPTARRQRTLEQEVSNLVELSHTARGEPRDLRATYNRLVREHGQETADQILRQALFQRSQEKRRELDERDAMMREARESRRPVQLAPRGAAYG